MNPTVFAMRRPITTLMLVVALISGGALAFTRMRVDIFPSLNTPKIYVFLDYIGMSPDQVEGFIVNQLELYFQYVDGIQDIDTRNIQQVALCRLSFFPGTDMGQAMAQVVAMSDRAMSWMPKGTLPPMIMRMDSGSVPVGYLVFESEETSLGQMGDYAQNVIRPLVQAYVPGTVAISPFGPNMRSIVINVDPQKLLAYNLTPKEVIDALATGNTIIPAGNVYIKDSMPVVSNNATVVDIQRLGDIPVKLGLNVYLRDVATFQDDTDITYGYALVNGKKSVYLPIIKKDTGSTLTVVADVHKAMETFREAVPKDVSVNFEFDESPTVVSAVESVATEGLIGAGLTGLMILMFLRDLRSVIVVVANIPLALLGSLFGLWATGNTINIMSLGGMALSIGILVDMSTVLIENIHVQMQSTDKINTAVFRGNQATAVPILLALMCILSVFVPAFIMGDPLRALFMPLTLAVGFAMISAYILSSTFVPVLCVALLKHAGHGHEKAGLFDRMLAVYGRAVGVLVRLRWWVVPGYLAACALVLGILGLRVGTELFPQIDSGQFVLRFRPPPGSNFELTRELAVKCLEEVEREAKPQNIAITMGYVGQVAPNFGIDNMVLFMRGPDDGQLRVALRDGSGIKLAEFRERLRKVLPQRLIPWLEERLRKGGLSAENAHQQARLTSFGFEPGDIVTKVMSFGSLTPIAVRVVGTDLKQVRAHAEKIARAMNRIKYLRDVAFEQTLDYPTVEVTVDREKAGLSGAKVEDLAHALVMSTASTRFASLNYWVDVKTGFDYLVQIQVPPLRMEKPEDVEILPLESVNPLVSLMIRDVAMVERGTRPGELDRDMSQRYLTVTANVEGEDMGRASRQVQAAIDSAGAPPRGVRVQPLGQLKPMLEMFKALGIGLAVSVFVIFVLLTANFQSPRLALISVGSVPGVLAGIATILYFTGTSLNIESFMGSIMSLGVSVSNSVLLVTFMNEHWKAGASSTQAAIVGAGERLRAILMTACAMTVGMVPMALALEKGSQMQAPLGLAVIGGLVMSTFATLLVVPSIFAVVVGRKVAQSPSIYPEDRDSRYYDPRLVADSPTPASHLARRGLMACCLLSAVLASGCESEEQVDFATAEKPPAVKLTRPEVRNIVRIVGQPSFIESYERSSVFPKLTGYIKEWKVDIGDKVKRGDTLATLFVPELVEDFETKKATVKLDEQRIELAKKVLKVAAADVKTAKARLEQARAILDKFKAEVERWDIEVKRLKPEVEKDVVDKQILLESSNQLKSSIAAREAAAADIEQAGAELVSRQANLEKATVDVQVAEANLGVAQSEARRLGAWVGYLKLPAPFDGVIVVRNANTFDFVLPTTGDPTAMPRSPHRSPSGSASPIYVVDRTDIVRVFVDIPEQDANYVQNGTKATVLAKAYNEKPIPGSVARTSWALNVKSRTLRAEIDLKNPSGKLLPGMYAYAKVIIERPNVHALPLAALTFSDEKSYCWKLQDGNAVRQRIRTGVTDGTWIEITGFQKPSVPEGADPWDSVSGSEQVIAGDVSTLSEGAPVQVLAQSADKDRDLRSARQNQSAESSPPQTR